MNPVYYAIPWFIGSVLFEQWRAKKRGVSLFQSADTRTSLLMGVGSLFTDAAIKLVTIYAYLWVAERSLFDLAVEPVWLLLLLTLVGQDFCYYWSHRAGHRVRILWAAHINHHSSEYYNLSTALRQSWSSLFSFVFYLPLAFIGFPLEMIFLAGALNLLYQFWIHTQLIDKMPRWFEAIFNTPSHHRVHHGTNKQYIDKNYAGIFIIWDRLLGTFEPEGKTVTYGLTKNIQTYNLFKVAFHEWQAMFADIASEPSWLKKLALPLQPPGVKRPASEFDHQTR